MAKVRLVSATGARIDTTGTPVAVGGVVGWRMRGTRQLAEGRSDGEIGISSADVIGLQLTGEITVDEYATAATLSATPTQTDLELQGNKDGLSAGTILVDKVEYQSVGTIPIPGKPSPGPTQRYPVAWEAVLAAADDGFDDILTFT